MKGSDSVRFLMRAGALLDSVHKAREADASSPAERSAAAIEAQACIAMSRELREMMRAKSGDELQQEQDSQRVRVGALHERIRDIEYSRGEARRSEWRLSSCEEEAEELMERVAALEERREEPKSE